jgi:hypothetical protein
MLYGWCVALAAFALAVRFVPHRDGWDAAAAALLGGFGLVALAASAYVAVVLEIVKLRRLRAVLGRRRDQPPAAGLDAAGDDDPAADGLPGPG